MAYTATYTTADLSPIVADFIGAVGANAVPFAALIIVLFILVWVKATGKKIV